MPSRRLLTTEQQIEFKQLYVFEGWRIKRLRAKYKIDLSYACTIGRLVHPEYGRSWNNRVRVLTKEEVSEILYSRYFGFSKLKDLAEEYNVSVTNIHAIVRGRIWKRIFKKFQNKNYFIATRNQPDREAIAAVKKQAKKQASQLCLVL